MRTLFAFGVGVVLGTVTALWLAARGDVGRLSGSQAPAATAGSSMTPSEPVWTEEARE